MHDIECASRSQGLFHTLEALQRSYCILHNLKLRLCFNEAENLLWIKLSAH